jgi:hypothetical protein
VTALFDRSSPEPVASDPPGRDIAPPTGLVGRLALEFPDVDENAIAEVVRDSAANYRDVRITQYVAIFVERESRQRLRETAIPRPRSRPGDQRVET